MKGDSDTIALHEHSRSTSIGVPVMENEGHQTEGEKPSEAFEFKPNRTYDIGVPRACDTSDVVNAKLITTGKYRMQSVSGSKLIAEGITAVDEFFKQNPLMMSAERPLSIYEIDLLTDDRTFIARGSVLPKPVVVAPSNDDAPEPAEATRVASKYTVPFITLPEPPEDPSILAEQREISALRNKLVEREKAMERSWQLAEQVLQQNSRMMKHLKDTLDMLKETVHPGDEVSPKLADAEAQIDVILKLGEVEEKMRKGWEEEREQWRKREREWEKSKAEKRGLGDKRDQLIPLASVIQMVLERVLPPTSPYGMPGMRQWHGNPQQKTPMQTVQRSHPSQKGNEGDEAQRSLNVV
ncbi:MAG: hypothetical protein ABI876_00740 [Bacteroidota bacterium]